MRPCSFMPSYKYQLFNFLLDLKAAFTELADIRVHEFPCFLYIDQVSNAFQQHRTSGQVSNTFNKDKNAVNFRMLFTKIEFHLSNICDLFSPLENSL